MPPEVPPEYKIHVTPKIEVGGGDRKFDVNFKASAFDLGLRDIWFFGIEP